MGVESAGSRERHSRPFRAGSGRCDTSPWPATGTNESNSRRDGASIQHTPWIKVAKSCKVTLSLGSRFFPARDTRVASRRGRGHALPADADGT